MFVTEATALLPHPRAAVAALLARVTALPRWCGGLRRVRLPDGTLAPCRPSGCALLYTAPGLRLALTARTTGHAPRSAPEDAIVHVADGDGVMLIWTFTLLDERSAGGLHTRLHVRTMLTVDERHPTAAHRATLARLIARRTPDDLARIEALLDRAAAAPAAP